ncbi:hypothetical protein [Metamycoplasma buccale]|uniref:hypothetical protein n=1 Tax=Metamycoplasma buccale TaxID=55602 RepID=UPI00398E7BD7
MKNKIKKNKELFRMAIVALVVFILIEIFNIFSNIYPFINFSIFITKYKFNTNFNYIFPFFNNFLPLSFILSSFIFSLVLAKNTWKLRELKVTRIFWIPAFILEIYSFIFLCITQKLINISQSSKNFQIFYYLTIATMHLATLFHIYFFIHQIIILRKVVINDKQINTDNENNENLPKSDMNKSPLNDEFAYYNDSNTNMES